VVSEERWLLRLLLLLVAINVVAAVAGMVVFAVWVLS
jgi:heme/copper-type cytochrome/quinol oxidase subunit 2